MKQPTPYSDFLQQQPKLENEFANDAFLTDYLKTYMPADALKTITPDLERFGALVAGEMREWARDAEVNEPKLKQFDAWGNRVDEIEVAEGWKKLERAAATEGLVAIGYERSFGEHSRLFQFVKLYLYTPSSAIYTCPLAMTDGAARLIEVYGDEFLKDNVFKGLISRQPETFLTSGQWMTERTGGSDVSRSMTFATPDGEDYVLHGHKWFTSAITASVAFTLASTEQPQAGKRAPLSVFFLPIRNENGTLNGIEVEALKDKLGTRALPTAQLLLKGCKAKLVGEKGKGVKTISTLFNITRIYNTISAVSYIRRAFALSESYGKIREAFGKKINEQPLYKQTLRQLEIAYQTNTSLALFLARLLGKEECFTASETEQALLRLLTPIAKLYTAKQSIKAASEHIESFGGLGYLEDSGIPSLLRDAQVLSIWEGTTNVLSLDMLRAMEKENGLKAFAEFIPQTLNAISNASLSNEKELLGKKFKALMSFIAQLQTDEARITASKNVAFYLAELTIAVLWLEFVSLNAENENYRQTLDYLLAFSMNELQLKEAEIMGLTSMAKSTS